MASRLLLAMRMTRLASLLLFLAACTDGASGAACPPSHPPTYADFGAPFFARYCTGCHSVAVSDRHGAPRGLDFDSEAEVHDRADAIDAVAAAGPDARNTDMPDMTGPVHVAPSLAERVLLGQLLACERGLP